MLDNIYILGAGGMAREVASLLVDLKLEANIKGFLVDSESGYALKTTRPVFRYSEGEKYATDTRILNGIGSPLRKDLVFKLENKQCKFISAIHPSVILGSNVNLGKDIVICPNSVLTCNINIGNHVIINTSSSISHDCEIGNFVTVSPGVNIGGRVSIGEGSFIGIGVTIIQDVKIGSNVFVGAGSTVVDNIKDNSLVYGSPAKFIKKINKKDWENLL